jgi:hypothetical protein
VVSGRSAGALGDWLQARPHDCCAATSTDSRHAIDRLTEAANLLVEELGRRWR